MDDNTRFEQLEEIIVELLRKQDLTLDEVGHLREAVAAQQLLSAQIQSSIIRLESGAATTRRELAALTKVVNRGFQELTIAYERNDRLLQETAVILAKHELFHQEMRDFRQEARQDIADLRQDVTDLRQDVTDLRQDMTDLRQDVTELRQDVTELRQDVTDLRQDMTELRQEVGGIRTTLDQLVTLLTKP